MDVDDDCVNQLSKLLSFLTTATGAATMDVWCDDDVADNIDGESYDDDEVLFNVNDAMAFKS